METNDIFQQMARRYDTEDRIKTAKVIANEIRGQLGNTQGKCALDYGCGTGLIGLALADLFETMYLIDAAPQMIEQVQKKIEEAHISTAVALCQDFSAESPTKLKFDYIFMSQVLLHIRDIFLILRQMFRILKKDGYLIIVDFDKNEDVISDKVHHGFEQRQVIQLAKQIGFTSVNARTFFHGEKLLMNQDASLFILSAKK
ncbi:MAG: methyltransferase domain-containing protein [Peptococcaceae bacterium]|nr:methyltransferase domain-containing protein [Peptococcaceae bacterium]